jgi:hypothetical protein
MQTGRIVQAVILMMIVALAASCATSKEYTSKLFAPRTPVVRDSQAITLRFLNTDSGDTDKEGWVTTDIIMGRDTASNTKALDKLAKTFPVTAPIDTTIKSDQAKTIPVVAETKTTPVESEPVAKVVKPGEVRNKRTRD